MLRPSKLIPLPLWLCVVFALAFGVRADGITSSSAQVVGVQKEGIFNPGSSAVVPPAYLYRGTAFENTGFNTGTYSVNIGTASSDRLVIVATAIGISTTITSVTVNGVTLNQDTFQNSTWALGIFSGLVTAGSGAQTIIVTYVNGAFQNKDVFVWTATGLNSNLVKHTMTTILGNSPSSGSINVTSGDFLFVIAKANSAATTFGTSTEAPHATNVDSEVSPDVAADWTIISTNAAFQVTAAGGGSNIRGIGASYR